MYLKAEPHLNTCLNLRTVQGSFSKLRASVLWLLNWQLLIGQLQKKICLKHELCVCMCVHRAEDALLSSSSASFAHHLIHTFGQNPAVHPSILILNTASKTGAAIFNLSHSYEMADGTRHVCILAPGKDRNSLCNAISAYFTLTQACDSGEEKKKTPLQPTIAWKLE